MEILSAPRSPRYELPRNELNGYRPAGERQAGHLANPHRLQLKRAVAALSNAALAEMNRRELVFAVRTAELPWLDGEEHWQHADRETLDRLAFLARETCRTQLTDSESRGEENRGCPDSHAAKQLDLKGLPIDGNHYHAAPRKDQPR